MPMLFNLIASELNGKGGDKVIVFVFTSIHHYIKSSKFGEFFPHVLKSMFGVCSYFIFIHFYGEFYVILMVFPKKIFGGCFALYFVFIFLLWTFKLSVL